MNNLSIMAASAGNIPMEPVQKGSSPIPTDNVQNAPGKMAVEDVARSEANKKGSTAFSAEEAKELVSDLNEIMTDLQTSLGFFIRDDLGHQVVVEIKNRETNELIKQIPSEELLQIKEKMEELNGLIFDQSV